MQFEVGNTGQDLRVAQIHRRDADGGGIADVVGNRVRVGVADQVLRAGSSCVSDGVYIEFSAITILQCHFMSGQK